jgi:transcriptional regulator with XRE-family HTH domain
MHLTTEKARRSAEGLTERILQVMEQEGLTQTKLSQVTGISQSTISRWISGYEHWPIYVVAMLATSDDPSVRALALTVLEYQAQPFGWNVVRRLRAVGPLDGDIVDELMEMVEFEGKISELVKSRQFDKAEKMLRAIENTLERAKAEVSNMKQGGGRS